MVSGASMRDLQLRIDALPTRHRASVTSAHVRPNLVVDGDALQAYEEDGWAGLRTEEDAGVRLSTLMPCARCDMVCVDPNTGRYVLIVC